MYSALREVDTSARPMRFSNGGLQAGQHGHGLRPRLPRRLPHQRRQARFHRELTYVVKTPTGPAYSLDGGKTLSPLPEDTTVSMNFWGFTPALFDEIAARFPNSWPAAWTQTRRLRCLYPTWWENCCANAYALWTSCAATTSARHDLPRGTSRGGRRHPRPDRRRVLPGASLGLKALRPRILCPGPVAYWRENMRLLCIGDSTTWGYDARSYFGERYPASERWVERLSGLTGCECVNLGGKRALYTQDPAEC